MTRLSYVKRGKIVVAVGMLLVGSGLAYWQCPLPVLKGVLVILIVAEIVALIQFFVYKDTPEAESGEHATEVPQPETTPSPLTSIEVLLRKVVDAAVARQRQDLTAQVREKVQNNLTRFRAELSEQIRNRLPDAPPPLADCESSLYPQGTKYVRSYGGTTIVVVEYKPQLRTLRFSKNFIKEDGITLTTRQRRARNGRNFFLAFPYTVFVVKFRGQEFVSLHLFYSNAPLASLDDPLYHCNLPNVHQDGRICLGNGPTFAAGSTLAEKVQRAIGYFWQAQLNMDMAETHYFPMSRRDDRLSNVLRWEEESRANPGFVLGVYWRSVGKTLRDVMGDLISIHGDDYQSGINVSIQRAVSSATEGLADLVRQICASSSQEDRFHPAKMKDLERQLTALVEMAGQTVAQHFAEDGSVDAESEAGRMAKALASAIVQVVRGDAEGARETCEGIIRQGGEK